MVSIKKGKKEIQKEVERIQGVVDKLTAEKESITQSIEGLKTERSTAVRALASGDDSRRKIILNLEAKIKDKTDTLEGLGIHLSEAETELQKARAALKQEEEAREVRWKALVAEEDGKHARELAANRDKKFEIFYDLFEHAALALGDLQLDNLELERMGGADVPSYFGFVLSLPDIIIQKKQHRGLKPVFPPGFSEGIEIVPSVLRPGGQARISGAEVNKVRREARLGELRKRFEEMEDGKK